MSFGACFEVCVSCMSILLNCSVVLYSLVNWQLEQLHISWVLHVQSSKKQNNKNTELQGKFKTEIP